MMIDVFWSVVNPLPFYLFLSQAQVQAIFKPLHKQRAGQGKGQIHNGNHDPDFYSVQCARHEFNSLKTELLNGYDGDNRGIFYQ